MAKPSTTPFPLRLPVDMRSALEERADRGRRSVNSEIVDILAAELEGKPSNPDQVPQSAITALTHRITWLETELLARQADLAWFADVMAVLVSALPLEAHADAPIKAAVKEAAVAAKKYRQTADQKSAADAAHREKFKQAIELLQQVQSAPELPLDEAEPSGTPAPKRRLNTSRNRNG